MKVNLVQNVEPGTYHGTFAGAAATFHEEYGRGIRLDFCINEGNHAGAVVSRTTKDEASARNTCGKFWEMVSGLPLEDAITHDSDEWVGDSGTIVVERSPEGEGIRVARFIRDASQVRPAGEAAF